MSNFYKTVNGNKVNNQRVFPLPATASQWAAI